MRRVLVVVGMMLLGVVPGHAASPSAEQKAEFLSTCLKVAPAAGDLCRCKADAAMTLVDASFLAVIIASMKGQPVEAKYYDAYNTYIAESTRACGMGM